MLAKWQKGRPMNTEKILALTQKYKQRVIELRREFHRFPEPSREEKQSQARIIKELERIGITEIKTYYNTGLAAVIRGGHPGRTIGIRADMDALYVEESTGLPFSSENPGVSHACGHDGHMAMLLGAAMVLYEMKDELYGNVKLIFQPAEEDGMHGGGSQHMIREGVMTDAPAVDFVIGQHVAPVLPVGVISSRPGPLFSTSDLFNITVTGKGGHSAMPHLGKDPVVAAAQIILSLQSIVSRSADPFDPVVISVGKIAGGTRHNVIPNEVTISGSGRSFSEETSAMVRRRISAICNGVAEAMELNVDVEFKKSYGPVINDKKMYALCRDWVTSVLGEGCFVESDQPQMAGEDFANFSAAVPGVYFLVGSEYRDGTQYPPHAPGFTFDEGAMEYGVCNLCAVAVGYLAE